MVEFRESNETSISADQHSKIAKVKTEGCVVDGLLRIQKIPGSLRIFVHKHHEWVQLLYGKSPDISHRIESFQFGNKEPRLNMQSSSFAPLDGYISEELGELKENKKSVSYEYYLNVVPTVYMPNRREWQFTASTNYHVGKYDTPVVYFRYDFSPLTIIYSEKSVSILRFVSKLLVIIGAYFSLVVFSVFICNSSVSKLSQLIFHGNMKQA